MEHGTIDARGRRLQDLRLSVTDRCNFRCRYCMPAEVFGPNYPFLEHDQLLRFGEIETIVRTAVDLGVRKLRLTGGEPLLRKNLDDLVARLAVIQGLDDLALTTNGVLLGHYAERLALAGLNRVTISLDALDPEVFSHMNGIGSKIERVLKGIEMAQLYGLNVKINTVIQKGLNESQIIPLLEYALERDLQLRFIEFMDVGETNQWEVAQVATTAEIQSQLETQYELIPQARSAGAVAEHYDLYKHQTQVGSVGFISSVTRPFCHDCSRLRVSADGQIYGCLFASNGASIRDLLRRGASQHELHTFLANYWGQRVDRYSELRGQVDQTKVEMSYIGG